jgi:hypothetical protein
MPNQTQERDEQHIQQQKQSATQAHTLDQAQTGAREAISAQSKQEIQRQHKQDEAALSQRWPELSAREEQDLKESFRNIAEQARRTRSAIENYERQVPGANNDYVSDARCMVDEEMRGTRNDVTEALERAKGEGGQIAPDIEERMNMRQEALAHLEKSITRDTVNAIENRSRQELIDQNENPNMKKALWELSGRELENRELADFRREMGLPDEALVVREGNSELIAANLSLKKVIDNIKMMIEDESADASARNQQNDVRAVSSTEQRLLQRQDDAALAERWPELKQADENQLKQTFREVSEQAEQTRQAIATAEKEAGPGSSQLQEMRRQVDEEMRLARRDVVEARELAENSNGKLSSEVRDRLSERSDRLEQLEREAKKGAGETVRAYLEDAGLEEAASRHRAILADNVVFLEHEFERAEAIEEARDRAAAKLRLAKEELNDFDKLLQQHVLSMRPDLVEARLEGHRNEERLRIDMTDISHRVGEVEHTIKAEIYREAMAKAFPAADISMYEYRSPTSNMLLDRKEFAERLERILEAREEEIRRRREETIQ